MTIFLGYSHPASKYELHKALTQMNLQIHHVLSDITGVSGLAIIDAILKGERNPQLRAGLRDGRVHASEETIRKSLVGNYRREHLFTLEQSLKAFRQYQASLSRLRPGAGSICE